MLNGDRRLRYKLNHTCVAINSTPSVAFRYEHNLFQLPPSPLQTPPCENDQLVQESLDSESSWNPRYTNLPAYLSPSWSAVVYLIPLILGVPVHVRDS